MITLILFNLPPYFSDGNYWDNRKDFGLDDSTSELSKAYAELITYTVIDVEKSSRTEGYIVVGVDVTDLGQAIVDAATDISVQENLDYEEMRALVNQKNLLG